MPYIRSSALINAKSNLNNLKYHLNPINGNNPYFIKQLILKQTMIEASSILEEYLKEVLENWIKELKSQVVSLNILPENMKNWYIYNDLKELYKKNIFEKKEEKVLKGMPNRISSKGHGKNFNFYELYNHFSIVHDKKFPSVKNIRALFLRFGINDIFKLISIRFHKNLETGTESFLSTRNAIAHTYPSDDLTSLDVNTHLNHVIEFITCTDRIIYTHILKFSSNTTWK